MRAPERRRAGEERGNTKFMHAHPSLLSLFQHPSSVHDGSRRNGGLKHTATFLDHLSLLSLQFRSHSLVSCRSCSCPLSLLLPQSSSSLPLMSLIVAKPKATWVVQNKIIPPPALEPLGSDMMYLFLIHAMHVLFVHGRMYALRHPPPHSLTCSVMFQNGSSLLCLLGTSYVYLICNTAVLPCMCVF